jgi:predicted metal-dependent hydrolase
MTSNRPARTATALPGKTDPLRYLTGYPPTVLEQVRQLLASDRLATLLQQRYPDSHDVRSDKALFDYVQDLKTAYLRSAEPLNKVCFDSKLHVVQHALGTHTSVSRVQGTKLKAKREIRVATLFKSVPPEFLRMIVVHELAHLKERAHDKAFYQLCNHMEPNYHQYEFDLRLYLTHTEATGQRIWSDRSDVPSSR